MLHILDTAHCPIFPTLQCYQSLKNLNRHLKTIDRGDDFAFLREIIRKPTADPSEDFGGIDIGNSDSGYSSRRDSKLSKQVKATPIIEEGKVEDDGRYFSRRHPGLSKSFESSSDVDFKLIAAGTPTSRSEESSIDRIMPGPGTTIEMSGNFFDPAKAKLRSSADGAEDYFDPHRGHRWTRFDGAGDSKESVQRTLMPQIQRSGINDLTILFSGSSIQPTNDNIEPADSESALDGAEDSHEQHPGAARSDQHGADIEWNIVQRSPILGRIQGTVNTSELTESVIPVESGSESSKTAKVKSTTDDEDQCLDTHPGPRVLGPGGAAEYSAMMAQEMEKRGEHCFGHGP